MKISRKKSIKTLIASLLGLPVLAYKPEQQLMVEVREALQAAWDNSQKYTLTVFNQMPEEKLDWKYTPESMSFRIQFVHCITFTASQLCGRLALKNPYEAKKNDYWAKLSKAALETELIGFYSWLKDSTQNLSNEGLLAKEAFVGGDMPVWKIFYAMENHIIHHRGQAICYLRLNGITPVGYIGWF